MNSAFFLHCREDEGKIHRHMKTEMPLGIQRSRLQWHIRNRGIYRACVLQGQLVVDWEDFECVTKSCMRFIRPVLDL